MRRVRSITVLAASALVLAGCTSGDEPEPGHSPQGSTTPSAQADSWTVDSLGDALLDPSVLDAKPVASVSGTVTSEKGDWDVQVDVLGVQADADGTDLTYVLRSTDGSTTEVDRRPWGDGRDIWNDTRSIVLVAPGGERLLPYTGYISSREGADDFCACGMMPRSVGEGDLMGALLPPLPAGTTTVTLELPGLEPLADVPVTWR